MKRNTTPTLTVTIPIPLADVKSIEFIFKKDKYSTLPALIHKAFDRDDIPLQSGDTTESFVVLLPLEAEETMRLPAGEVYMDTRIVLRGNVIPATEIVKIDVMQTLFEEAPEND